MASMTELMTKEAIMGTQMYLYKEGFFWKAYQYSAYRVNRRQPGFKLTKKYVKTVSCEVISLGFPDETLHRIFSDEEIVYINEKLIGIPDSVDIDMQGYNEWFQSIPLTERTTDVVLPKQRPTPPTSLERVLQKIREFSVEQSTPMDCMILISQIRKELVEYGYI